MSPLQTGYLLPVSIGNLMIDHHSSHYKRFAFTFCPPRVTSFVPETGPAIMQGGDQGSDMLYGVYWYQAGTWVPPSFFRILKDGQISLFALI